MEINEQLERLGIYNLRNHARFIGVKCPTTKNKSQLISEIIQITNGEIAPHVHGGRGRQPRATIDHSNTLEIEKLKHDCDKLTQKYNKLVTLLLEANKIINEP